MKNRFLQRVRRHLPLLVCPCLLALMLALSACGNVGNSSVYSSSAITATVSPTVTQQGTTHSSPGMTPTSTVPGVQAYGCPDNTVVTTPPTPATVTLTTLANKTMATVAKGATVEIDLPFSQTWTGPLSPTQSILQMQSPAGYAFPAAKSCAWRFVALSPGTATLTFNAHASCHAKRACPMYIVDVHFVITVH